MSRYCIRRVEYFIDMGHVRLSEKKYIYDINIPGVCVFSTDADEKTKINHTYKLEKIMPDLKANSVETRYY